MRQKDKKKIYNSKRWKTVREIVILRDNLLCQQCLKDGFESIGEEVDHIEELSDRPDLAYDIDNLQLLCRACHVQKTYQEKSKRLDLTK